MLKQLLKDNKLDVNSQRHEKQQKYIANDAQSPEVPADQLMSQFSFGGVGGFARNGISKEFFGGGCSVASSSPISTKQALGNLNNLIMPKTKQASSRSNQAKALIGRLIGNPEDTNPSLQPGGALRH